jgi:AMOP domain
MVSAVTTVAAMLLVLWSHAGTAIAQATLPFPFGASAGDEDYRASHFSFSFDFPFPMKFFGDYYDYGSPSIFGCLQFYSRGRIGIASACVFFSQSITFQNAGIDQNKLWVRSSGNATDLLLSRNIIAGTGKSFAPEACAVATWHKIKSSLTEVESTFQLTLAYDKNGTTWAIMAYTQIQYAKGVEVRFVDRNFKVKSIAVADTAIESIRLLEGTNCGIKGVYAYQVDGELLGCGIRGAEATMYPFQGPIEGGTVVQVTNLTECLENSNAKVFCKFENPRFSAVVTGVRVSSNDLECVTPFVDTRSTMKVSYVATNNTTVFNPATAPWIAIRGNFQFFGQRGGLMLSDPKQSTVFEAGDTKGIVFEWNASYVRRKALSVLNRIKSNVTVTLQEITARMEILAFNNATGKSVFDVISTIPVSADQQTFNLVVSDAMLTGYYSTQNGGTSAVIMARLAVGFGDRTGATRSSDVIGILPPGQIPKRRHLGILCDLYLLPRMFCPGIDNLPICPPNQTLAVAPNSGFVDDGACKFPDGGCEFHPGAAGCYRARGLSWFAGQQCCYNITGVLITDPYKGGGTVDCVSSEVSVVVHLLLDVRPYFVCCKLTDSCKDYYRERPTNDGAGYIPPRPPARAFGDPHFLTIDGMEYSFNGAGEFVAFCGVSTGNLFTTCNPSQPRLVQGLGRLSLHLRLAPRGGGTATVGAALEDPLHREGLHSVAIVSHPTRRIDFFDGDTLVAFPDAIEGESMLTVLLSSGMTISRSANMNATSIAIKVSTPSGLVLELSEIAGVMLPVISLPSSYTAGRGVGLFGFVDGNATNDFTSSTGSVVSIATNVTQPVRDSQIFSLFGTTWMIRSVTSSLFKALQSSDQSFAAFFKPSYVPLFQAPAMNPALQGAADAACSSIHRTSIRQGCYFDIAVTGDAATFGAAARAAQEQQKVVDLLNSASLFVAPTRSPVARNPAPTRDAPVAKGPAPTRAPIAKDPAPISLVPVKGPAPPQVRIPTLTPVTATDPAALTPPVKQAAAPTPTAALGPFSGPVQEISPTRAPTPSRQPRCGLFRLGILCLRGCGFFQRLLLARLMGLSVTLYNYAAGQRADNKEIHISTLGCIGFAPTLQVCINATLHQSSRLHGHKRRVNNDA